MQNKKLITLAALSLLIVASISVKPAMAYFTDTTTASGKVKVEIANTTSTINEEVDGMVKTISVTNTGSYDAFVRVKAVMPSNGYEVSVDSTTDSRWSYNKEEDYYYYSDVVASGESTANLVLNIDATKATIKSDFNVIIVEEAAKVLYDTDGKPYASWDDEGVAKNSTSSSVSSNDENTTTINTVTEVTESETEDDSTQDDKGGDE